MLNARHNVRAIVKVGAARSVTKSLIREELTPIFSGNSFPDMPLASNEEPINFPMEGVLRSSPILFSAH